MVDALSLMMANLPSLLTLRINTYYNLFEERKLFMKVSELKKLLKKHGCTLLREGENHEIWYSPITKQQFAVPRHNSKELPTGTEKTIKKQSGIL